MATGRKRPASQPKRRARTNAPAGEREQLLGRIVKALGVSREEAELRALRELAERVAPQPPPGPERVHVPPLPGKAQAPAALPLRLFLLLDGRGLDGRGLPIEVIDVPTTVGSGRSCTVWVNSPQIETRHLQIAQEAGAWILEDLGTENGTFLGGERVRRRRIEHGDEYRLAGYLRLRAELR